MRPHRIARAARAFALVCALACLGVARGDLGASEVGAGGSDPETRAPPPASLPSFPTEADTAFAAWLASKGGAFTGAGVWSYVETGRRGDGSIVSGRNRGVFAKDAAVENGDVVFEASLDAALMVPSERAGPIINAVAERVDPEWALAFLLVRESSLGASSPYAPFLRMALADDEISAATGSDADADARATALTRDAVRALNGTFAGAYHDAMIRRDEALFSKVKAMTIGTFPAAFPDRVFGDRRIVARALAVARAKGVRFPVAYDVDASDADDVGVRFRTAAALVPVAHALPHDPRGAEPCVAVAERRGDDEAARRPKRLVVRVAAAVPGEELRCHRGAATAVPDVPNGRTSRGDFGDAPRSAANGEREQFRFASATATGALTDAEAAFRFGGVGVGLNAHNAVAVILADPRPAAGPDDDAESDEDVEGDEGETGGDESSGVDAVASRARRFLLTRCGPESARALTRDGPSDALRCAVRVATADDAEAAGLARRLAEKDATDEATRGDASAAVAMLRAPVSNAAEARALAALLETTAAILDGYPTSDARDESLLRRGRVDDGDEDLDEDEDEDDAPAPLADDIAEAVRCRLREKRLLLDALNSLQRAASVTLPEAMRLDVIAGEGASVGVFENEAKSPPGGFEVKKTTYGKEL